MAAPVGAVPLTQLRTPVPFVLRISPLDPSPSGRVQICVPLRTSGDLNAKKFVVPRSVSTSLRAVVLLPRTVRSPATVVLPAVMEPVVSITVLPLISELPFIVPAVITGLRMVLLLIVPAPFSVTTTPELG